MQQKELRALRKENYQVPMGEEKVVHYKIEVDRGLAEKEVRLVKTSVKMFPTVKRLYEEQGSIVEILHHPNGEYTQDIIPLTAQMQQEENQKALSEKDAEIAELKARLAELEKAKAESKPKAETKPEEEKKKEKAPSKNGAKSK